MCGICGVFHIDGYPASTAAVDKMASAIAHRGPDGYGVIAKGPIGLGHRRLAIIDLSPAAAQPMQTPKGDVILSYNGEIYNFQELRRELEDHGYQFRSSSDTEVVLNAYLQWGEECVARFNGMFAFAIWDERIHKLFLARDRYGIKPLYYGFFGNSFLFGSEQKAILAHPKAQRRIDFEGLMEYFTFQNIFSDHTLLKGIKLFPPGHTGWIRRESQDIALKEYWDYNFAEPDVAESEGAYIEELDRLFQQAVNRQLVSDVEVSAYLSGGVDSGAITAVAAKQLPYIKTFTCGFDLSSSSGLELSFDERAQAEAMSALFKTEHYEMVLKAGDMERCIPRLAWHLEEPRAGQCYPNFYAAQLASKFGKVVLAGTGGDELFGGYPWRYYRAAVNSDFEAYIDKYYLYWQRLIPNSVIKKVFQPVWSDVQNVWTRDIFKDVFSTASEELTTPEEYINHSLYFEAKTFLHSLLILEDKMSMAHSLESRIPFLDNDLVDFAMKLPVNLKLGNLNEVVRINENEPAKLKKYFVKTKDGKLILRKAMGRHVPQEVSQGEKQGFSAPDASWFKGESIDYVRELLFNHSAMIYDYLDRQAIHTLVNEHLEGKCNRRLLIWSLINVEWWLKLYIKGETFDY